MNEVIRNILTRRSVRSYTDEKLSRADIETIIESGLYAPSSMNLQPWHITVIEDSELIGKMDSDTRNKAIQSGNPYVLKIMADEGYRVFHNAPLVMVLSSDEKAYNGAPDCASAVQNMLLAAHSIGIGSCVIGFVRFLFSDEGKLAEYRKKLQIPDGYKLLQAVIFGRRAGDEPAAPPRKENTVNYV